MFKKKIFFVLLSIGLFSTLTKADSIPEPGYMRVSAPLVFELTEDFSDYRFFLDSPADIDEVEVKKGETKNIDSAGRGGSKRIATLVAIPKSELEKLGITNVVKDRNPDAVKLKALTADKQNPAVIRLINHSWLNEIRVSERAGWTYPTYRIERDGTTLKAVKTVDISPKLSLEEDLAVNKSRFGWGIIAAAGLIGLAVVVIGVYAFRKVLKKG